MATISVNFDRVVKRMEARAVRDGALAAERVLARAREKAPVRKIFNEPATGRSTTYRENRSTGFREPVIRSVTYTSGRTGQRVIGQPNSEMPVIRIKQDKSGRTDVLVGDLRKVGKLRPGDATLVRRTAGGKFRKVEARTAEARKVQVAEIEKLRVASLSSRGRFEASRKRARYNGRVGGRLKGELHIPNKGSPTQISGVYWWYVRSATKDPETGRLYPRDQEFGTSHHPPHPFLRPALQESRNDFRRIVRKGQGQAVAEIKELLRG